MPLGSRAVERIVIGDEVFGVAKDKSIDAWLNDYHGQFIEQTTYDFGPTGPIRTLYLVHLR